MAVVFISHSSRDNEKVQEIVRYIEDAGFDSVFLDHDEEKGIKSGKNFEQRLYKEIRLAPIMLLLVSPAWIESKWCFVEYNQARSLGKEIIPIIMDEGTGQEVDNWIDRYLQKTYMTQDNDGLRRVVNRIKEIVITTQNGFEWPIYRSPYPGMTAFLEEDAAVFFGREEETKEAIEDLNAMKNKNFPKIFNIVAASGMGKSSFLKAGIIPHLKRAYSDQWHVLPVFRPAGRPLYAFAKLIASVLKKEEMYKEVYTSLMLENYKEYLDDIITEIEFILPSRAVLFSLDQAEELYFLGKETNLEREIFFQCISYILEVSENFFVILTLRADFLNKFQSDELPAFVYKSMKIMTLTPIRNENISLIIKQPAVVANIFIDDMLIEKIKEDMQTTDALPILAMGLRELYLTQIKEKELTLKAYKALSPNQDNPLEYIVQQKIEEVISPFTSNLLVMNALEEAFVLYMVSLNENKKYIKISAVWDELPKLSHAPLECFIEERLCIKQMIDEVEIIEISHDALIRKWPLLQLWLSDAEEFHIGKQLLGASVKAYDAEDEKNKYKTYLTGLRLEQAVVWLEKYSNVLEKKEKEFINESRNFSIGIKRKHKVLYSLLSVILVYSLFYMYILNKDLMKEQKITKIESLKYKKEVLKSRHNIGLVLAEKSRSNLKEYAQVKAIYYAKKALEQINMPLDNKELLKLKNISRTSLRLLSINKVHKNPVRNVMFSFDGSRIASSSEDNSIKICNTYTQKEIASFEGASNWICNVLFSKNGKRIAFGTLDNNIQLWDIESQKLIATFKGHNDWVNSIDFSLDGKSLVSTSLDNTVRVWDVESQKQIEKIVFKNEMNYKASFSFNSDDIILYSEGIKETTEDIIPLPLFSKDKDGKKSKQDFIKIWNWKLKKLSTNSVNLRDQINKISFSANRKRIVSGIEGNGIKIWDIESSREVGIFRGVKGTVNCVAFSPDDNYIASGSDSGIIQVWDTKSKKEIQIIKASISAVYTIAFAPDGNSILSGSADSKIQLWDCMMKNDIEILGDEKEPISSIAISPDGENIVLGREKGSIELLDRKSKKVIAILQEQGRAVQSIIFSPDGNKIISGEDGKRIQVWNVKTKKKIGEFNGISSEILVSNMQKYASDMNKKKYQSNMKVIMDNGVATLKTLSTSDKSISHFRQLNGSVNNMGILPEGSRLITCSSDGSIQLWDRNLTKEIIRQEGKGEAINSVSFSPDGKNIIVGSSDGSIQLWNKNLTTKIKSVSFSHDDETSKLISSDGSIQFWNKNLTIKIKSVSFSPDGKNIVVGSSDGSIQLWDRNLTKEIIRQKGKGEAINSVSFSPDGSEVLAILKNGQVIIWDIKSKNIVKLEYLEYLLQAKLKSTTLLARDIAYIHPVWPIYHPLYWEEKARDGDKYAMYQLGTIYEKEGSNKKALYWYRKALINNYKKAKKKVHLLERWMQN